MSRDEVLCKLISILTEVRDLLSDPEDTPGQITESTVPIGGIPNFDSIMGVNMVIHVAHSFNMPDDDTSLKNLFLKEKSKGETIYYSVGDIADTIYHYLHSKKRKHINE